MKNFNYAIQNEILKKSRRRNKLIMYAAIVLFGITAAMSIFFLYSRSALAAESDIFGGDVYYCGIEEHAHTAGCYMRALSCGIPEGATESYGESITKNELPKESPAKDAGIILPGDKKILFSDIDLNDILETEEESEIESEEETEIETISEPETTTEPETEVETEPVTEPAATEQPVTETKPVGHKHSESCYTYILACGMEEHIHTDECRMPNSGSLFVANPSAMMFSAPMMSQMNSPFMGFMAAAAVINKTEMTSLTIAIDGTTIYTLGGIVNTNVEIKANSRLTFSLDWIVTDNNYIFQEGDTITFDILTMDPSNVNLLPPTSIPLYLNGMQVAIGKFFWAGTTLKYEVEFTADAKKVLIGGGSARGTAQFNIIPGTGSIPITFTTGANGTFTVTTIPGDPGGGGTGTPNNGGGVGIGNRPEYPWEKPPTEGKTKVDLEKQLTSGMFDRYSSPLSGQDRKKVPIYNNAYYYGFTWRVPFRGFTDAFKNNPGKSTEYIIIEDTVSANMEFASYDSSITQFLTENGVFNKSGNNGENLQFFSIEIPLSIIGYEDKKIYTYSALYTEPGTSGTDSQADGTSRLYLYQKDMIQFRTANEHKFISTIGYPAPLNDYTAVEAAVKETPFSYGLIKLSDGRWKLIVNVGRFGENVPNDEGIKWDQVYSADYPNSPGMHAATILNEFLKYSFTPYENIVQLINGLEKNLKTYTAYTNNVNNIKTQFESLKNALITTPGYLNAPYNAIPNTQRFRASTSSYANLKAFLNDGDYINGWGNLVNDDPNKAYTHSLAKTLDECLANYHISYTAESLENSANYCDATLKTLLFYFPNMKNYFNYKLNLGLSDPINMSDESFINEFWNKVNMTKLSECREDYVYETYNGWEWYYVAKNDLKNYLFDIKSNSGVSSGGIGDPTAASINSIVLWYRTILVDESVAEIKNEIKVSTFEYTKEEEVKYNHEYGATIWGLNTGEIAVIKADRYANNKSILWEKIASASDFSKITAGLAGAKFEVYAGTTLQYFKQTFEDGIPVYTRTNVATDLSQLTTGPNGTFKLKNLVTTTAYTIREVSSPDGWYLNTTPQPFTPNTLNYYLAMYDIPSGVALKKVDADDNNILLNGAVFQIKDNNGNVMKFTQRTVDGKTLYWYSATGIITDLTTAKINNNDGRIYVFGLPAGDYNFVEIKAPTGYETPDPLFEKPFKISSTLPQNVNTFADALINVNISPVSNEKVTAPDIKLLKVGVPSDDIGANGTPMSGIGFKLAKTDFGNDWNSIIEMVTDANGYIIWDASYFGDNFAGTYKLIESTPPNGVTPISPIMFNIDADGKVTNLQNSNNPLFVTYTNQSGTIEFKIKNEIKDALLKVTKTVLNNDGEPVNDDNTWFEFTLKDSNNNAVALTTGATGNITFIGNGGIVNDGTAGKFELQNGASATISGLINGEEYTVTETSYTGYITSVKVNNDEKVYESTGTIKAKAGDIKSIEFFNQEVTWTAEVIINGKKIVNGTGVIPPCTFTFTLTQVKNADGDPLEGESVLENPLTVDVLTQGKKPDGYGFTFPEITGLKIGTYYFKVSETDGGGDNWYCDNNSYTVVVVVNRDKTVDVYYPQSGDVSGNGTNSPATTIVGTTITYKGPVSNNFQFEDKNALKYILFCADKYLSQPSSSIGYDYYNSLNDTPSALAYAMWNQLAKDNSMYNEVFLQQFGFKGGPGGTPSFNDSDSTWGKLYNQCTYLTKFLVWYFEFRTNYPELIWDLDRTSEWPKILPEILGKFSERAGYGDVGAEFLADLTTYVNFDTFKEAVRIIDAMMAAYNDPSVPGDCITSLEMVYEPESDNLGWLSFSYEGYQPPVNLLTLKWNITGTDKYVKIMKEGESVPVYEGTGAKSGSLSNVRITDRFYIEHSGTGSVTFTLEDDLYYLVKNSIKGDYYRNMKYNAPTINVQGGQRLLYGQAQFAKMKCTLIIDKDKCVIFKNKYEKPKELLANVIISGKKSILGSNIPKNITFTFQLTQISGPTDLSKQLPRYAYVTTDDTGVGKIYNFAFDELTGLTNGTYMFKIIEVPHIPALENWTYDATEKIITVVVANGVATIISEENSTSDPLTFTNNYKDSYEFEFIKVNEKGETLAGAEFSLYETYKNGVLGNLKETTTSNNMGKVSFTGLKSKVYYYMKETSAPYGYQDNDIIYRVYINSDATFVIEYLNNSTWSNFVSDDIIDGDYIIRNIPEYSPKLPETGGMTTFPFILLGTIILFVALCVYSLNKSLKSTKPSVK